MKKFDIPPFYRSSFISRIKAARTIADPRKKDYSPTKLDFGSLRIILARHFGFCYGVENAIEIAYKTIEENSDKRIYLLSEMIHNPEVNNDLLDRGVQFIMNTYGEQIIPWEKINSDDIVIIPAFGTTLETEAKLKEIGIDPLRFNTTCPFVEKVWTRAAQLGDDSYTVIIHGKSNHEETRATFSHSIQNAPAIIVRDINETIKLGKFILGELPPEKFYEYFEGKLSKGFEFEKDLIRVGVVNQTTMLADETQSIADHLREVMIKKYGQENLKNHIGDTRDTLCYATNDNQQATAGVLNEKADLAIVLGGYNSSNTTHIVELCEAKLPTYFISNSDKILSQNEMLHFDVHSKTEKTSNNYLPTKEVVDIIVTSGASCPDAIVEEVIYKLLDYFPGAKPFDEVIKSF